MQRPFRDKEHNKSQAFIIMTPTRYRSVLDEYNELLTLATAISLRLNGRHIEDRHLQYVGTLFQKLISHGSSLLTLSPSADTVGDEKMSDLPSACAVSRALIETYDAMSYIGSAQITPSERDFRMLLWEQHDYTRRLTALERIGSANEQVGVIRERSEALALRIKAHPFLDKIPKDARHRLHRESNYLTQRELNAANGINHGHYEAANMHLSQYVHSLPLSLHQLMGFRPGEPEAIHLFSMPLQYAQPFMAKSVEIMFAHWPEFETSFSQYRPVINRWIAIAAGITQS